jgi:O-antigen/teichoic acid export membrane protein
VFRARILSLVRQTSVYSISWLSTGLASIVLLPVYTAYITPTEYGIIQMLDYTLNVFKLLVVVGMVSAVYRFMNEYEAEEDKRRVIATGMAYLGVVGTGAVAVLLLLGRPISAVVLGPEVDLLYIRLALAGFLFELWMLIPMAYFAARQQAKVYLLYALGRLLLNIILNLYFIIALGWGAAGMLSGNLVSGAVFALLMLGHCIRRNGLGVHRPTLMGMLRFGAPLVPASVAATVMHNVDRYILRAATGLHDVGLYSLGYRFPFMLSSLIMTSFNLAWSSHAIYEIAKDPDAREQYARIATYYMTLYVALQYTLAIFGDLVVRVMADEAYRDAADVVPVVCAAMCLFSFNQFVTVGAFIQKKTLLLPAGYVLGALVNVGLNLYAVPRYGYMGAAWVSVVTYFAFVTMNYWVCRTAYKIEFQFLRLAKLGATAVGLYLAYRAVPHHGVWLELGQQAAFVLAFPLALLALGYFERHELVVLRETLARGVRGGG